ncbi:MAG: flagellar export chaperone FliS [Acetatifactor sp.]|nr:flagellar export chaperone FliS [Acetatifactor sp.]
MTSDIKQQFTFRISQANSTEMIVILYEMTLQYLSDAAESVEKDDFVGYQGAVRRARGCIGELLQSLHLEYELAAALRQLYLFCLRRLAQAEVRIHPELLQEVASVITPLCDAYRQIAAQNTAGPVMQNTQVVYAGLTYGKNTLTENMTDQSMNRGMLI